MANPTLVFLGTSGGGEATAKQLRSTGGFRINGSLNIHVDPGPGALSSCAKFGQDPRTLHAIAVTHKHIDHYAGMPGLLERIFRENKKPKLHIVGSRTAMRGDENGEAAISQRDLHRLDDRSRIAAVYPERQIILANGTKSAILRFTPTRHGDKSCVGFVLKMDGAEIGYTSDTEYFDGLPGHFKGCKILIANNIRPDNGGGLSGHLFTETAALLISEVKPLLAIITHFGVTMLDAGPENEAMRISEKSGVQTIAAYDGMSIDLQTFDIRAIAACAI